MTDGGGRGVDGRHGRKLLDDRRNGSAKRCDLGRAKAVGACLGVDLALETAAGAGRDDRNFLRLGRRGDEDSEGGDQ